MGRGSRDGCRSAQPLGTDCATPELGNTLSLLKPLESLQPISCCLEQRAYFRSAHLATPPFHESLTEKIRRGNQILDPVIHT